MSTFYHGDCLFVMQHDIPPESVDLIYLDPPFFTGKVQRGQWEPGSMEIAFDDSKQFWADKSEVMRDKAPMWLRHLALTRPDFASYLFYMVERLQGAHQVLKPTGSIYLHCDSRASSYLKMVMDGIFGPEHFLNEVIWRRTGAHGSAKRYGPIHDTILYYSKSDTYTWNPLPQEQATYVEKRYSYVDANQRRFYPVSLIAAGTRRGSSGATWRGIDVTAKGNHWRYSVEHLEEIDAAGDIYWPPKGGTPRLKMYYEDAPGAALPDIWDDIPVLNSQSKERSGYPTQKPEMLLRRIIEASSKETDIVLDPFCGCGTTIYAAQKANRQWIGIDINRAAYDATKGRDTQLPLGMREEFAQAHYVSRDIDEVRRLGGRDFEAWVNEFYRATKPSPDSGVDGITPTGIPIQSKTFEIKYNVLSQFVTDARHHPLVPKPVKEVIVVSKTGFDDSARRRKFEIETTDGIKVRLETPEGMLGVLST